MGGLVLHPNGDLLTWVRECGDPQTMSARLAEEAAAMEDKRKCRRGLSLPPNLNFACCEGCVALELPGTLVNEKDCHDGNQSRGFCCCGSPGRVRASQTRARWQRSWRAATHGRSSNIKSADGCRNVLTYASCAMEIGWSKSIRTNKGRGTNKNLPFLAVCSTEYG